MKHSGIAISLAVIFTLMLAILTGLILIHRMGYDRQLGQLVNEFQAELKKTPAKIKSVEFTPGIFGAHYVALQDGSGFLFSDIAYLNNSGYFAVYYNSEYVPSAITTLNDMETDLSSGKGQFVPISQLAKSSNRGIETFIQVLSTYGAKLKTRFGGD